MLDELQPANERLASLTRALEHGTLSQFRRTLNTLRPPEIAALLESLPARQRAIVWELVNPEDDGDVLLHVNDAVRASLIREMDTHELVAATEGMAVDDLADLLQDLPDTVTREVLRSMDKQNRERVEAVLSYPEDSAGGLMNTDLITVRADVTLDVVLRYLRLRGELPEQTDSLVVVNRYDNYLGLLPLSLLLTTPPVQTVAEVMSRDMRPIPADMSAKDVARRFEEQDLVSAPVIDAKGKLVGRITVDDVVDVIRDEAEASVRSMAGLSEDEDMFAPVIPSARRRALWLGINLITALLASWVIGLFEGALDKVVALAILMPIVASMGGIAGSQTLTLVVRGLALGQVGRANTRWLIIKEVSVGLLNGLVWALVVAGITWWWFDDLRIGAVIAAAMVVNLFVAALSGVVIPLAQRRMGIDPALAGGVMLTTITDVVGFMTFLGLGTLFLV
jgi:magnesium transporter